MRMLLIGAASVSMVGAMAVAPSHFGVGVAEAQVTPVENPPIDPSCGLDLTLVLDASGSVQSSNAVEDVRDSGRALLEALVDTDSSARVTQFASLTQELAPRTDVTAATLAQDGPLGEAVAGYYNPKPQRPDDVTIYGYNGGDPQSAGNFNVQNSDTQYTNWDQSLDQAGEEAAELVVYVTDGDPTSYGLDQTGDPFNDSDVAVQTSSGAADQVTLDRAVDEANAIKQAGTRVLAVGVGAGLSSAASQDRLKQIAGPQLVEDLSTVDDINQVDVAAVANFEDLSQFMRDLVFGLCAPSLTVRKLAQDADDTGYHPEAGWPITVEPTSPGGFEWVLPDTSPGASKTQDTGDDGFAQFQWSTEEDSTATVTEGTRPDYTPGRPDGDDYVCQLRDASGSVRSVSGDFADPDAPGFELDPIGQEIVTCTVYNSFDYDPQLAIEKTNSPGEVRGDLDPGAEVTSDYVVTAPGNAPVANVQVTDDKCGPVEPVPADGPNAGDTDQDGLLDPGEEWQFTCSRPVSAALSTDPAGQNIVNTASASGSGPNGESVEADDDDDVDVFTPAVELEKTASPETVVAGDDVTYTYVVTNTGNTPLDEVTLTDDTPPCEAPALVDSGNGDDVLDVGESWTYECTSTALEGDVINTGDVSGRPLNPLDPGEPFPGHNPPVVDIDTALVEVENPNLDLTKSVDRSTVVLEPGDDPAAEQVTYTFEATNTGTDPLTRPAPDSTKDQGWVSDAHCDSPAEYVGGDSDDDDLLDPGETWQFTCGGSVSDPDRPTPNIARIDGVPTDQDGTPIPDVDREVDRGAAIVDALQPGVEVTKAALRRVVLDPDTEAVEGPDVPDPRSAEYRYEVVNTGDLPLSLDPAPTDDTCDPLTFVEGDTNGDGLLDVDEVWVYSCTATLQREDATQPPGDESAEVENTVTVTGVPSLDGDLITDRTVIDTDEAKVAVIEPGLAVTKTASTDAVKNGNDVTYTVEVENTGDTVLLPTAVTDDKCAPLEYVSGDDNGNGLIDGANTSAEVWVYTCTRAVFKPEDGVEDVNTVTANAVDPLGNRYEASDDAEVIVVLPAIHIEKTPSALLVPAGTDVTYTFEVINVGQSDIPADDVLEQVTVRDVAKPGLPECRKPELVAKEDGNQDDLLERDPAEVWVYECTAPIEEATTDLAVVAATGGSSQGRTFGVGDFDVARVGAFHPGLEVEKTAEPTELEGRGKVTYTYEVVNTGDVPLAGVAETISDDTCEPVTYVSGDLDDDGLLDTPNSIFEDSADETWVFTCTTTVNETTQNTVTVDGSPSGPNGGPLCGPDAADFLIQTPCDISGDATATVRVVDPGEVVDPKGMAKPGKRLPATGVSEGTLMTLGLGLLAIALGGAALVGTRRRRAT